MQRKIVEALRAGNYREITAAYAGIAVSTLYHWLERGEAELEQRATAEAEDTQPQPMSAYAELSEAVTRAEAEAEVHAVASLRRAFTDDWRAAAEYLQRRHPKRWSKTDRLDVELDQTVQHNVVVDVVPEDEKRAEVARILAEAHGSGDS